MNSLFVYPMPYSMWLLIVGIDKQRTHTKARSLAMKIDCRREQHAITSRKNGRWKEDAVVMIK
jgi:hypothetical protein